MLDTCDESCVYLGTKEGVKLDELVDAFKRAQETGEFDDAKWINCFPRVRLYKDNIEVLKESSR